MASCGGGGTGRCAALAWGGGRDSIERRMPGRERHYERKMLGGVDYNKISTNYVATFGVTQLFIP